MINIHNSYLVLIWTDRHWEYETKIKHPAPHHHKGGDKGWTKSFDSGDKHKEHYKHFEPEVKHELVDELPINIPINIPKYDTGLDHYAPRNEYTHYEPKQEYHYEPKKEYHYEPKKEYHYEPKKEYHYEPVKAYHYEPKKKEEPKKKDNYVVDINVDGIIDDIQKDLRSTRYIAKAAKA